MSIGLSGKDQSTPDDNDEKVKFSPFNNEDGYFGAFLRHLIVHGLENAVVCESLILSNLGIA